jgi:AbiU2
MTEGHDSRQSEDVAFWLKELLTELRLTQAHYRSLSSLAEAAQRGEWFHEYGDFVELALDAHAGAVLAGAGRLLDRDPRTASVHWLVRLVEGAPEEFAVPPEELRAAIERLEDGASTVRRVRNKLVAHRERSQPDQGRELRRARADALGQMGEILGALDSVVAAVMSSDSVRDWRFTMIATEPWVEDVLAALRRAPRADPGTR